MRFHAKASWEQLAYAVCALAMADMLALNHRKHCRGYLATWSRGNKKLGYKRCSDEYLNARKRELREWGSDGGGAMIEELGLMDLWKAANRQSSHSELIRERARKLYALATGESLLK